jgi:amidase
MSTELWRWGATDLAGAIREKKVSSREVVQAHLDRIGAVNEQLNAITVVLAEEAMQPAAAVRLATIDSPAKSASSGCRGGGWCCHLR